MMPFLRRCALFPIALGGLALAGTTALAEETLILSVCQDGPNGAASQTAEDMGRFLEGTWRMSANGTGFTLGTNVMTVSLQWDPAAQSLIMAGDGMATPLVPVTDNTVVDFDVSLEAMTPIGLTQDEIEVLTGCANPPRYAWQVTMGGNQSWGALMFFENDAATGFMANSAGGSRTVYMTR